MKCEYSFYTENKDKPDYNTILQKKYTVPKNNFPTIIFAGAKNRVINKDALLKADSLFCTMKEFKIVSFTMTVAKDTNLYEYKSTSNVVTAAMKKCINELVPGNKIYFEDIKVIVTDGTIRMLASVYFKIR